jgi:hypothetical protein
MYGEPFVDGSQTVAERLEARSDCPMLSGAADCPEADRLVVIRRNPANAVAHRATGVPATRLLIFISLIPLSMQDAVDANLLVGPRDKTLNNKLEEVFCRWYPRLRIQASWPGSWTHSKQART